MAGPGDDERAGWHLANQSLGVIEPLDHPDVPEQAVDECLLPRRSGSGVEQTVEPANHAGMAAGIEGGAGLARIVRCGGRREGDPATGHEHRLRLGRVGPVGKPAHEVIERIDDEALAERAEREVDEVGPADGGVDHVAEHAQETWHGRLARGRAHEPPRRIGEPLLSADEFFEHALPLAAGLEFRLPAGEIPPGRFDRGGPLPLVAFERFQGVGCGREPLRQRPDIALAGGHRFHDQRLVPPGRVDLFAAGIDPTAGLVGAAGRPVGIRLESLTPPVEVVDAGGLRRQLLPEVVAVLMRARGRLFVVGEFGGDPPEIRLDRLGLTTGLLDGGHGVALPSGGGPDVFLEAGKVALHFRAALTQERERRLGGLHVRVRAGERDLERRQISFGLGALF